MSQRTFPPAARRLAVLALALFAAYACNPIENESTSSTLLIIESLTGLDLEGLDSNLCKSDVLVTDSQTGSATVVADLGKAVLSSQPLAPNPVLGNSVYQDIQLHKISISYSRADGHNAPGIDVPYPFEVGVSSTIRVGTLTAVTFTLVREAAKVERPLVGLRGTMEVIEVTAAVVFYGKDLSGRTVKATGYIPVTFADFANE